MKTFHTIISCKQKAWLKSYFDRNTDLRKKVKNDFETDFYKLMNNAVFGKTIENMRKHRDTILFTTERIRNYLESEPNFQATKFFTENLLATEMKKRR